MANNKKDFSDKTIKCKKCLIELFEQRLDAQVLIVGGVAIFNMVSVACLACESINTWQSPHLLRDENESLDRRFPDRLEDLPKPEKRIAGQLRVKGVSKAPNGKFKARIIVGGQTKYLGLFDSIGAASAAYEKARQRFSGSSVVT
jgi:hypothetical protein